MMFQRPLYVLLVSTCCAALAAACAKGVDEGGGAGGGNPTTTSSGSGGRGASGGSGGSSATGGSGGSSSSSGSGGSSSSSGSGGSSSSSGSGGSSSSSGSGGSSSSSSSGSGGAGGDPVLCNNGFLDPGEECDQTNYGGETCDTLGFNGGAIACDPVTCNFDTTGCITAFCGNDVIDPGEECDGIDLGNATCQSIGLAGGTIACDGGCTFVGCYDHYTQDFEASQTPPGWTTSGNAVWIITTGNAHGGSYGAESGWIWDNETSSVFVTLSYDVPGNISFWHKESTESGFDYLEFYVDSSFQADWSGINSWAQASFNVGAGQHTFEWRYAKDGSVDSGLDTVWIDDIVTQNGYMP